MKQFTTESFYYKLLLSSSPKKIKIDSVLVINNNCYEFWYTNWPSLFSKLARHIKHRKLAPSPVPGVYTRPVVLNSTKQYLNQDGYKERTGVYGADERNERDRAPTYL